jgi:thiamine-phosphate pyrophosphorylase
MLSQVDRYAVLRILDANYNRAVEGLRTLEEEARFRQNWSVWQGQFKKLRHQLAEALGHLSAEELLKARWAVGDVGPDNTLKSEQQRQSLSDIRQAAASRIQQSLRCLEEFSKPISPTAAEAFGKIRYQAYDLLGKYLLSMSRSGKVAWNEAKLYLLVDLRRQGSELGDHVKRLADCGADVIQIREKNVDDRILLDCCSLVVEALREMPTRFVVNDRIDIALLAQADAVHVGQEDLPPDAIRKLAGQSLAVGISTHNQAQVIAAEKSQADYIGCGPTFPSTTKSFQSFAGLEFLKVASQTTAIPAFAIGGITLENLPTVLASGISRVAIAGDIQNSKDPYSRVKEYKKVLTG